MSAQAMISLHALLAGFAQVPVTADRPVNGLASDSRRVQPGNLFLAVQGLQHHGLEFLPLVLEAGAAAVAWEPPYAGRISHDEALPLVAVEGLSQHLGRIGSRFYGDPAEELKLIGVTGTDGKTSCSHFIAQALASDRCALIGTLGYGFPGRLVSASRTTPDALTIQSCLADFRDQGARYVAMEVSSHALQQDRVGGLDFEVAVLTNLTRDHLDYHGDLAAYAEAKRRLFVDYHPRHAVLNLDDPFGRQLGDQLQDRTVRVGYGLGQRPVAGLDAWIWGENLALTDQGLNLRVVSTWGDGWLRTGLLGRFNASNLLAAMAALLLCGIPFDRALQHLAGVSTVAGRMERLGGQAGKPLAVVDYAHTPNAVEQVLKSLREHARGRLWCVFGCGGDRDPGKRPLMGAHAERYADRVIVTSDNPRTENPDGIVRDILAGMHRPQDAVGLGDRRQAIHYALAAAEPGDVVAILGKGHEDYQLLGTERIPFSDREEVLRWYRG